jgi:hypothetical protein
MSRVNINYYRSIATNSTGPIDHGHGRVQMIDGDIFYSPNSRRTVGPPPKYRGVPVRQSDRHCFTEFYNPRWWQPHCPYLPFVPLEPTYLGVPFSELLGFPPYFPRSRMGFSVDPSYSLGWARLAKLLVDAIRMLLSHLGAPAVVWISNTAVGCKGTFRRLEPLRVNFLNAKRWFSQWMAAMSYAIAISKTLKKEGLNDNFPFWFSFLSRQQYSQVWLSGLKSSLVDTFSPSVERVGVFVELLHPSREQPSVDWLCSYHIPVWYPWGDKESRASLSDNGRGLARFAPPTYQLQEATTFLTKSPGPPSPQPASSTQPSSSTGQGYDCKSS